MNQTPSADPRDDIPVRDTSNLMAFMHILRKAHVQLVGHDRAHQRFCEVVTRGQARAYIRELMGLLLPVRERHRQQGINRNQT